MQEKEYTTNKNNTIRHTIDSSSCHFLILLCCHGTEMDRKRTNCNALADNIINNWIENS